MPSQMQRSSLPSSGWSCLMTEICCAHSRTRRAALVHGGCVAAGCTLASRFPLSALRSQLSESCRPSFTAPRFTLEVVQPQSLGD